MRVTTEEYQDIWKSGDYTTDERRPMIRATIQRLSVVLNNVGRQTYSTICHGQSRPRELPNVKSVTWGRSVDGGVATMSMTLWNMRAMPIGWTPDPPSIFDQPGFYTPTRGLAFFSESEFSHGATGWQNWLVPDRLIRTYEGYGFDPEEIPETDPHLVGSGVWRIDDVSFGTDGMIRVECRDVGSALLDQVMMPPVVPVASYPLTFETRHAVDNPDIVTTSGGWFRPVYDLDSNFYWIGNDELYGHHGRDAFDSSNSSYWFSIGNSAPEEGFSFEWVQGKFSSRTVSAVRLKTWGGPYLCYVSVWAGGKWQGSKNVPYFPAPGSAPNASKIRYSYSFIADREDTTTFKLKKAITGATKVRLTFTRLTRSSLGRNPYRAGVRKLEVSSAVTTSVDGGTHVEPKTSPPAISDYTDIVKILLAYAGWHWPRKASVSFQTYSDGTKVDQTPATSDSVLGGGTTTGRVWGDFELTGTSPVVAIGVDAFDKKPVMDGISMVRDTVGFIFFIDEDGAAVFRSPNIWSVGNWVGNGATTASRVDDIIELRDTETIMDLSATLSSRSIRESVFVGNLAGQVAGMSKGHNPYPSGLRRVGGWTDQHFKTAEECQIMADLITLRQLFTYRTDKVRIPANAAVQIDDQVRLVESITEEGFLHYITGIQMNWDIETGKYTYDLSTHWLGETPFSNWTFNPDDLAEETRAYLIALGKISG